MKLREVVIEGKFCGLETVEECILNFELHAMQMFPYSALEYERKELNQEIKAYENGKLELNMEQIDEEVARLREEYEKWLDANPPTEEEMKTMFKLEAMR